jgi:putative membrane protein
MNDGMHSMFGTGMGGCMFLWWFFVIIVIVGAVLFFVRQQGNFNREKSALDLLKERYARGEISKQEFEEKKRDIL